MFKKLVRRICCKSKKSQEEEIIYRGTLQCSDHLLLPNEATEIIGKDWVESQYYDIAENFLNDYWDENKPFYKFFSQLDCSNIVELACGHGRHVQKYLSKAQTITLVDINKSNIDFCKNRFLGENKISYLVNDGIGFDGIKSNSQTAIFSYDSMVHFEIQDIMHYLKDANRILVDGGKILFHHSNASFSPQLHYYQKPHARNFLSADIFAYFALRNGFTVLQQAIFSWGQNDNFAKNIDCLSLCQKTKTFKS
jgi:ubiquinone/menaquinone biosynthesis C-methylase UbiE